MNMIKGFYADYGYFLVFFGAVFEATFLIGFYFPGSTIILLGAALSKSGIISYPMVFILGLSGLLIGYTINYFLGRYGWYQVFARLGLEKAINTAKEKVEKHKNKAIFLGYISPGPAAFISIAAGTMKIPFKKFIFLSFVYQAFWSLIWGNLAYFFGLNLVQLIIKYFFWFMIGLGVVWILKRFINKSK